MHFSDFFVLLILMISHGDAGIIKNGPTIYNTPVANTSTTSDSTPTTTVIPETPKGDEWIAAAVIVPLAVVIVICLPYCYFKQKRTALNSEFPQYQSTVSDTRPRKSGGRNVLRAICFNHHDLERVKTWSKILVQRAELGQVFLHHHVVTNAKEGRDIPACQAAFVFVFPDERNVILEDARRHIADKRVETVKDLLYNKANVYLMIYDDEQDQEFDLYNHGLKQIEQHEVLQQLRRQGRILSLKNSLAEFQIQYIATSLKECFK